MATEIIEPAADVLLSTDEAFLELVCADDDWLRAEFEAIIEAGWPEVPRQSPHVPSPRPCDSPHHARTVTPPVAPPDRTDTGDEPGRRQRSPPRTMTTHDPDPELRERDSRGW